MEPQDKHFGQLWQGLLEQNQRTVPRCLRSHPQPDGAAPSLCAMSPVSGATRLHLSSPSPGGPGPRDTDLLWVSFSHLRAGCQRCAVTGAENGPELGALQLQWREKGMNQGAHQPGPLLSFAYISLGLRKGRLSFKPANLFPGPSPEQWLSWIFPGFMPLIQSDPFPSCFQAIFLHFIVATWAPIAHAPSGRIFLLLALPPLVVYGKEPVVPWEDWKASLPACLGMKIPLGEDSTVYYDVWSYNFQDYSGLGLAHFVSFSLVNIQVANCLL